MKRVLKQIMLYTTLILILFLIHLHFLIANNNNVETDKTFQKKINNWMSQSVLGFEENKGQFADYNGNPLPDLLFKTSAKGMDMYITTRGITYLFIKSTEAKAENFDKKSGQYLEGINRRFQRSWINMDLSGATIKKENIITEYPLEQGTTNYYLGHCSEGILDVQTYRKVTIKSIYPGIDWILYTQGNGGLKYDFIVHPGADPTKIKMSYKGAEGIEKLDDETLKITTSLGEIKEGKLISYEEESLKEVKVSYQTHFINANLTEVSFNISNYDLTQSLVIDPPLLWATYYGGTSSEWPNNIITDVLGNIYVSGITESLNYSTEFLLDSLEGAYYQDTTNYNGVFFWDAFILKFDSNGVRQWATLYGGISAEFSNGIAVDKIGNLYMTGSTSSRDFPLENPGGGAYYDGIFNDGTNIATDDFILKFNSSGARTWATFFGGSNSEGNDHWGQRITVDINGNLYISGITSSSDFPLEDPEGGAYFQTYRGGNAPSNEVGDAFIAKFDPSNNLVWSTYYGGYEGAEGGNAITTDIFGNIFVTGWTTSSDFPIFSQGGAYSQSFGGENIHDIFILKFNKFGNPLWSTFFGGKEYDFGSAIAIDKSENLYVTGWTNSINFPVSNPGGGAYFQPKGGDFDAFILKFDSSGSLKWSTYYGGQGSDRGSSLITDNSGNLFVVGDQFSDDFPLYGCAYNTNVNKGFFVLEFDTSGIFKWSIIYVEGWVGGWGTGITTDNLGYIYNRGRSRHNNGDCRSW